MPVVSKVEAVSLARAYLEKSGMESYELFLTQRTEYSDYLKTISGRKGYYWLVSFKKKYTTEELQETTNTSDVFAVIVDELSGEATTIHKLLEDSL